MATPKTLVSELSRILDVPEATMICHDRNLQEAGIRKKALRGRGENVSTANDAAALIVAALASDNVKDSANSVVIRKDHVARLAALITGDKSGIDQRCLSIPIKTNGGVKIVAEISTATINAIATVLRR
jgi:hypothetical protein